MSDAVNQCSSKLTYGFSSKPLLIGGKAMEYYGLRTSGNDIDFVVTSVDYEQLASKYPGNQKEITGGLGLCIDEIETWRSIYQFDYQHLKTEAIEEENYLVISLERLLCIKALGMREPKHRTDLELLVKEVLRQQQADMLDA